MVINNRIIVLFVREKIYQQHLPNYKSCQYAIIGSIPAKSLCELSFLNEDIKKNYFKSFLAPLKKKKTQNKDKFFQNNKEF